MLDSQVLQNEAPWVVENVGVAPRYYLISLPSCLVMQG